MKMDMNVIKVIFVACLLISPFALHAEDGARRLLFSGFTIHEKSHLDDGEKLNAFNFGLGYERDYFKDYKKMYYTYHVMLLDDSHKHPYLYLAGSGAVRFHGSWFDTSAGIAGFVGIKNMRHKNGEYHYAPIVGAAPVVSLYKDKFTLNFSYVPSLHYSDYSTIGFLFIYAGWQFN